MLWFKSCHCSREFGNHLCFLFFHFPNSFFHFFWGLDCKLCTTQILLDTHINRGVKRILTKVSGVLLPSTFVINDFLVPRQPDPIERLDCVFNSLSRILTFLAHLVVELMHTTHCHLNIISQLHTHLLINSAHVVLLVYQVKDVLGLLLICLPLALLQLFSFFQSSIGFIDTNLGQLLIFLQFFKSQIHRIKSTLVLLKVFSCRKNESSSVNRRGIRCHMHLYVLLVINWVACHTRVTLGEEVGVQRGTSHIRWIGDTMKLSISVVLWWIEAANVRRL